MSYLYPWLTCFSQNYATLKQIGAQIPATLRPAYQALLTSGATIQSALDAGTTVSSDDAKQWLSTAAQFAGHLQGNLSTASTSIKACSQSGIATADDSIIQPLDTIALDIQGALQSARDELSSIVGGLPSASTLVWIGVAFAALWIFDSMESAPKHRKAKSAGAAT